MTKGQIEAKARELLDRARENLERTVAATEPGQRMLFALQAFADASSAVSLAELVPPSKRGHNNPFEEAWNLHENIRGNLQAVFNKWSDAPPASAVGHGLRVIPGGKPNPALDTLKRKLLR